MISIKEIKKFKVLFELKNKITMNQIID